MPSLAERSLFSGSMPTAACARAIAYARLQLLPAGACISRLLRIPIAHHRLQSTPFLDIEGVLLVRVVVVLNSRQNNPFASLPLLGDAAVMRCGLGVQGACSKAECPYLHINLDPAAAVCKAFLNGYCERGASCRAKHLTKCMLRESCSKRSLSNIGREARRFKRSRACFSAFLLDTLLALQVSHHGCDSNCLCYVGHRNGTKQCGVGKTQHITHE